MTRRRLDVELVRRHLARSREHAQELIANGLVKVAGTVATKSASMVDDQISIVVRQKPEDDWVFPEKPKKLSLRLNDEPPKKKLVLTS